jgi:urease gamma subunit
MNVTPREKDKLMIALAAMVARGRPGERYQTQLSREHRAY